MYEQTRRIRTIHMRIDGSCKINPGPAAIAVVAMDEDGNVLEEHKEFIGKSTSNRAEYTAAIRALEIAMKHCRGEVYVFSDSELLVNQVTGLYKIKKKELRDLLIQIKQLEPMFKKVNYVHIPREKNSRADMLANQALINF